MTTSIWVAALALALAGAGSTHAVELKPLMKDLGFVRTEIGKEIHLTHGEVQDGTGLAALIGLKYPPAAPYIAAAIARIQREDHGNGAIVEVLYTGMVVGVRSR